MQFFSSCAITEAGLLTGWCFRCRFDATRMRQALAKSTCWKDVSHLDEAFIHQNMKNLAVLQIIGPPGQPLAGVKAPEP